MTSIHSRYLGQSTRWPTEVPSNPYYSVILWFCDLCAPKASEQGEDNQGVGLSCLYPPLVDAAPQSQQLGVSQETGRMAPSRSNSSSRREPSACGALDAVPTRIASWVSPRDAAQGPGAQRGPGRREWRWQCWGRCWRSSPWPLPAPCPGPGALWSTSSDATQHLHESRSLQGLCIAASRFSRAANLKSLESFSEPSPHPSEGKVEAQGDAPLSLALVVLLGRRCPHSRTWWASHRAVPRSCRPMPFPSKDLVCLGTAASRARGSSATPDDGEQGDEGSRWYQAEGLHPLHKRCLFRKRWACYGGGSHKFKGILSRSWGAVGAGNVRGHPQARWRWKMMVIFRWRKQFRGWGEMGSVL